MKKIIKKIFLSLVKRKTLLPILFFILFGVFFLPQPASAAWYDFLVGAITFLPSVAVALVLYLLVGLSSLLAAFSSSMLTWVTGPTFTTLSYTNPARNDLIRIGLEITQGFVNMLLVLILVYIALATILRLAGYETKKLLVTFILVALLVNFAPVVCGLIVDASNIVTNFFLENLSGSKIIVNNLTAMKDSITSKFSWTTFKVTEQIPLVLELVVLIVVNIVLFLILLLFTFIFVARYIVIWILVILSPLAFACYILPATKKYWSMWWSQLVQWSFIGVTCAFFLYMAEQFAVIGPGKLSAATGLGSAILPHMVSIAFLLIGLIFGLQTSAMGASGIINLTKRGGKWAGGKVKERGVRPMLERVKAKEAVGRITKVAEKVPGARWFLPEKFRQFGEMRPAIDTAKAKAKAYSSTTLAHRMFTGADTQTDASGSLMTMLERSDAQDVFKGARGLKKWKGKSDDELLKDKDFQKALKRPLDIAQRGGILSAVVRRDPRLAAVAAAQGIGSYAGLTSKAAITKAVGTARSQHIDNWEPEELENKDLVEATLGHFELTRFQQITNRVKNGQSYALNTVDNAFSEFVDREKTKDPKLDLNDNPGNWKKYQEYIKKITGKEGYFKALENKRFKDSGWRVGEYRAQGQRPSKPTVPTPGAAAGLPPPPPPPPGSKKGPSGRAAGGPTGGSRPSGRRSP